MAPVRPGAAGDAGRRSPSISDEVEKHFPRERRPDVAHPPVQAVAGAAPAAHHRPVPRARLPRVGRARRHPRRRRRGGAVRRRQRVRRLPQRHLRRVGRLDDEPRRRPRRSTRPSCRSRWPRTAGSSRSSTAPTSLALLTGRDLDERLPGGRSSTTTPRSASTATRPSAARSPRTRSPCCPSARATARSAATTRSPADGVGCIVCHTRRSRPAELAGRRRRSATTAPSTTPGVRRRLRHHVRPDLRGPEPVAGPHPRHRDARRRRRGLLAQRPRDQPAVRRLPQRQARHRRRRRRRHVSRLFEDDDAEELGILEIIDDRRGRRPRRSTPTATSSSTRTSSTTTGSRPRPARQRAVDNDATASDGGDGLIDDLVLQTTFDEWQDYVAFDSRPTTARLRPTATPTAEFPNDAQHARSAATAATCPSSEEVEGPVVDYAPGAPPHPRPLPSRAHLRRRRLRPRPRALPQERPRRRGHRPGRRRARRPDPVGGHPRRSSSGDLVDRPTARRCPSTSSVRNNLLAHAFPTGFAFARQFWLEVSAETATASRSACCRRSSTATGEPDGINAPCGSGFADAEGTEPVEGDAELRQCDTRAVAETLGVDPDDARVAGGVDRGHRHRAAQPRHRLRRRQPTPSSPAPSAPTSATRGWPTSRRSSPTATPTATACAARCRTSRCCPTP